jgi:hypothetical protein
MKRTALLLLLLAGCGSGERRSPGPPPPSTREFAKCAADLSDANVKFRALPNREFGGGCSATGSVQLLDIGVPVANLGAMRCGLAEKLAEWVRRDAVPAADSILGGELVKVETFGTYACRNTVGTSGPTRLSGHAIANAVDISAFVLRDGRRISVLGGWRSDDQATREYLQAIRRSACRRFGTVLSPDYNAAHANHLHFEDDNAAFCR